ncbi:MAG: Gx transporter family protein [Treponema sp.]|nr:Gx transporter family protein [Treponema sp.]
MKNRLAFFSALCFFLAAVEMAIPKPLPFMRLGLANLPIMAGLALLSIKETILLIFLKVLLQAFVSGTLFSYVFIFSLAGTLASGFGMMLIYHLVGGKRGLVSWFGISLFGGLMNNLAQILVAKFVMFGENISYVAPLLLAAGFVCSGVLGVFMNLFWKKSRFVEMVHADSRKRSFDSAQDDKDPFVIPSEKPVIPRETPVIPSEVEESYWKVYLSLAVSLAAFVTILITSSLYVVYGIFLLFLVLNLIKYKKVRILSPLLIIASVTFLELLSPAGKILWQYGSFKVTDIPLVSGLLKSGKLCAMVVVSKFAVNRQIHLPGKVGQFVSEVFGIFGELNVDGKTEAKKNRKSLIAYIDMRLCEVWQNVK